MQQLSASPPYAPACPPPMCRWLPPHPSSRLPLTLLQHPVPRLCAAFPCYPNPHPSLPSPSLQQPPYCNPSPLLTAAPSPPRIPTHACSHVRAESHHPPAPTPTPLQPHACTLLLPVRCTPLTRTAPTPTPLHPHACALHLPDPHSPHTHPPAPTRTARYTNLTLTPPTAPTP